MFLVAVHPICILYTTVVQEVYNRDPSPEVDNVEGLAVAATKHLELFKQKHKAEGSFIIKRIVGKFLKTENVRPFPIHLTSSKFHLHSDSEETNLFNKLSPIIENLTTVPVHCILTLKILSISTITSFSQI